MQKVVDPAGRSYDLKDRLIGTGYMPKEGYRSARLNLVEPGMYVAVLSSNQIANHGADDAIVPVNQGRALAQAAPNARFVEVSGATHNEIPMMRLRQELDAIMAALPPARSLQPPQ